MRKSDDLWCVAIRFGNERSRRKYVEMVPDKGQAEANARIAEQRGYKNPLVMTHAEYEAMERREAEARNEKRIQKAAAKRAGSQAGPQRADRKAQKVHDLRTLSRAPALGQAC